MRVAVVDIGSNSIKLLVASREPGKGLVEVGSRALEVRISKGIGSGHPRLSDDGMDRGIAAVRELVSAARGLGAGEIVAVATSAVRDASNGAEFRDRTRAATGLEIRILSGLEEANLIGLGLTTDPALDGMLDFHVFDLGGGSLECLAFRNRTVAEAVSLPLGCARLTEKFVPDPSAPFAHASSLRISRHVRQVLRRSGFPLPVPPGFGVVGTGGTLTTVRAMAAAKRALALGDSDPLIGVALLRDMLAEVGPKDLASRSRIAGLAPERADIFPAALETLLVLADMGGITAFRHSLRNLRWGLAAECLR
jgi:exopolyphosphatase/guanosine-5'-triphosphate,3'-diphosphate pyrophosphatase